MSTTASQTNNANDAEIKDSSKSSKVDVNAAIFETRVIIGALFTIICSAFAFIYGHTSIDIPVSQLSLNLLINLLSQSWMLTSASGAIPISCIAMLWEARQLKKLKIQAKAEQDKKDAQQEQVNNSLIKKNEAEATAALANIDKAKAQENFINAAANLLNQAAEYIRVLKTNAEQGANHNTSDEDEVQSNSNEPSSSKVDKTEDQSREV